MWSASGWVRMSSSICLSKKGMNSPRCSKSDISGPPSITICFPEGLMSNKESPCPTSSMCTCKRPSGIRWNSWNAKSKLHSITRTNTRIATWYAYEESSECFICTNHCVVLSPTRTLSYNIAAYIRAIRCGKNDCNLEA